MLHPHTVQHMIRPDRVRRRLNVLGTVGIVLVLLLTTYLPLAGQHRPADAAATGGLAPDVGAAAQADTGLVISGYVTDQNGQPLVDVLLNGLPGSPRTNDRGFYTAFVERGWTGEITPQLRPYSFTPQTRIYSNLYGDYAEQNFIGLYGGGTLDTTAVTELPSAGCFEEAHAAWTFEGDWNPLRQDGASMDVFQGFMAGNPANTGYAEFTFSGDGFALLYYRSPYGGMADVYVDNLSTPYTRLDMYADTVAGLEEALLEVTGLDPDAQHRVRIVPVPETNPLSLGDTVAVDRIDVPAYDPIYDDNCPASGVFDDGDTAGDAADLELLTEEDFENGTPDSWSLPAGWPVVADADASGNGAATDGNHVLAVSSGRTAARYGLLPLEDVIVQADVRVSAGVLTLGVRQSASGGYALAMAADGTLTLLRGEAPVAEAAVEPLASATQVHLEAVGDTLRVLVEGEPVLDYVDASPLPAGVVTWAAADLPRREDDTVGYWIAVDNVSIWGSLPARTSDATTTVGNRVWDDLDYDGIQDPGEPGVDGVRVDIYKKNGKRVGRTTTSGGGYYSFTVKGDQVYFIKVKLPDGYDFTTQFAGSDPYADSDFDQFTGKTPKYTLYGGSYYTSVDAGLVKLYNCQAELDLMLVLDGSGSIDQDEWNIIKSFSRGLANSFRFGRNGAKFGIVQFASPGRGKVHLGLTGNRSTVMNKIKKMSKIGGSTDIGEGVRLAQRKIDQGGRNAPTPHAMVILTDGAHNGRIDPENEALKARAKGTVVYVVAVDASSYYIDRYINPMASDPDSQHVFEVDGLNDLVAALYALAGATCDTPNRPKAPKLVSPRKGANVNAAIVDWDPVDDATQYEVWWSQDKKFRTYYWGTTTSTSFWWSNPPSDGKWYWKVRGLNGDVPGPWSKRWYYKLDRTAPDVPDVRSPSCGSVFSNDRPKLKWTKEKGASKYDIRLDTAYPPSVIVETKGGTSYRPPSPLLRNTYYWQVRARDKAGNVSGWSSICWFTVQSKANDKPLLNRFTSLPTLRWEILDWAIGYEIQVNDSKNFRNPHLDASTYGGAPEVMASWNWWPDGLWDGTWYWRVRGIDAKHKTGKWSSVESFTVETN